MTTTTDDDSDEEIPAVLAKDPSSDSDKNNDPAKVPRCLRCKDTFSSLKDLIDHCKIHAGPPFSCGVCGKCYTRSHGLKKHTLTHTGERPYPCNVIIIFTYEISHY